MKNLFLSLSALVALIISTVSHPMFSRMGQRGLSAGLMARKLNFGHTRHIVNFSARRHFGVIPNKVCTVTEYYKLMQRESDKIKSCKKHISSLHRRINFVPTGKTDVAIKEHENEIAQWQGEIQELPAQQQKYEDRILQYLMLIRVLPLKLENKKGDLKSCKKQIRYYQNEKEVSLNHSQRGDSIYSGTTWLEHAAREERSIQEYKNEAESLRKEIEELPEKLQAEKLEHKESIRHWQQQNSEIPASRQRYEGYIRGLENDIQERQADIIMDHEGDMRTEQNLLEQYEDKHQGYTSAFHQSCFEELE